MTPQTIAYVDGAQMLYRAEFGFPTRIRTRRGQDITGTFGFLALMRQALHRSPVRPTHALVIFDADAPSPRTQLDARYRAERRAEPPDSSSNPFRHLPAILRALDHWGISHVIHGAAEADDVIATLVDRDRVAGRRSIVISRDKDFHQLLRDTVHQWDSAQGLRRGWITEDTVVERYGIRPARWCDSMSRSSAIVRTACPESTGWARSPHDDSWMRTVRSTTSARRSPPPTMAMRCGNAISIALIGRFPCPHQLRLHFLTKGCSRLQPSWRPCRSGTRRTPEEWRSVVPECRSAGTSPATGARSVP